MWDRSPARMHRRRWYLNATHLSTMSRTQTPPSALTPAVQRRPVAGARRAIPRRIHGARLRSPPRRGPSGASRSDGQEWALTPVPPRAIPPAGHGDRPPAVARCRAHRAARRCRGPRSPCPSRRPGHARCGRRGFRRRRPGRGSAPRCVPRAPRCRCPSVRIRRCGCRRGSGCPVSRRQRAGPRRSGWPASGRRTWRGGHRRCS